MSSAQLRDVVIIGSGPAGYTAAIYTARAGLKPLVFEGIDYGGSLMTTTEVENFPGFPAGIMGPELMENMRTQAEKFGAELRSELVDAVDLSAPIKRVSAGDDVISARTVILAMGSAPRYLGVPGEDEFHGRGVSACATCDGFFFRDKVVAVVGGGDSAMEEALFLTTFASRVYLIHRRDTFRASPIMTERMLAHKKIVPITNSVVTAVLDREGTGTVSALELSNTVTGESSSVETSAMFVAIGSDPRSSIVATQIALGPQGHILVQDPSTRTNVPGVFAIGDVVDPHYKQAITAAATGCKAALDAQEYLLSCK